MNTKARLVYILVALLIPVFNTPASALAYSEQIDCPALKDIHIIQFEAAEARFEKFREQRNAILFFGDISASLNTIGSQENGEALYCEYLASRQTLFPTDSPIYTYPYLGSDYTLAPTENGADIVASPEQTPEPGRDVNPIPDHWWGMTQLIALMTGRDQAEGKSDNEPIYTIDELMAEPKALAKAYIYAQLWDADKKTWKTDLTEVLQLTIAGESFGTVFVRTFLVALAERMSEIGYNEKDVQKVLASVRFLAIADVVPPFEQEAISLWARLESVPTLSIIRANEDFARFYGALPFYEPYVPLDSKGNLSEGVWPLVGERYLYVKGALDQANVHGVKPADLAPDPVWRTVWERLQDGVTLIEAVKAAAKL